jgi:hypothetical protein
MGTIMHEKEGRKGVIDDVGKVMIPLSAIKTQNTHLFDINVLLMLEFLILVLGTTMYLIEIGLL